MGALFVVVDQGYDARIARDAARTPHVVDPSTPAAQDAVAWYTWRGDALGVLDAQVLYLAVTDPGAPPPPGLPEWPAAGDVWASPALLELEGSQAYVARYGSLAGVIQLASLVDDGERIAYVGVRAEDVTPPHHWVPITGFGVEPRADGGGYLGAALYHGTKRSLVMGLVLFGVAPALVAAIALLSLGAEERRRHLAQVQAMGGSPRQLRAALLRVFLGPAAVGSGLVTLLLVASTYCTWRVPIAGISVPGADYGSLTGIGALLAVGLLAAAAVVALVLWLHRAATLPRVGQGSAPRPVGARGLWVLLLCVDLALANWGYAFFYTTDPSLASFISLSACAVALVLLVPTMGVVTSGLGRVLGALALRTGSGPVLVGAREVQHVPRATTRITSVIAMAIVLSAQLQVWGSQSAPSFREAVASDRVNADLSMLVDLSTEERAARARLFDDRPAGTGFVALGGEGLPDRVLGDCEVLVHVFGECPESPKPLEAFRGAAAPQVWLWGLAPDAVVERADGDALAEATLLAAVSLDGRPISQDALLRELGQRVLPPPRVAIPQEETIVGAWLGVDKARWYAVGGLLALVISLALAALSSLAEVEKMAARHGVVAFYGARRRHFLSFALTLVGVPAAVAAALGACVAVLMSWAPTSVPGAVVRMPFDSVLLMLAVAAVYSAGVSVVAALRIAGRRGARALSV
ncbi:hypothetical protein DNL40_07795 [Xylanimonas oleitrophica]|uniref:FtsX-like permease family protein n=1 Tax=Xylanimonas oleitrophica TaxID=2607479 RepID=A0A2W5WYK2_9MICO|nr:hypothetical protein DNL40_07795 [Xylanimonas oleitrophica]